MIVSAYLYMYITIKKSYQNMSRLMSRQSRENKIGRQMALIVLTNSMCWFPIIVLGLLAMSGVNITGLFVIVRFLFEINVSNFTFEDSCLR